MSKQDELDKLKLKQDHAKASIHGMECGCLNRNLDIIALEAEIAEEAKPKLRHGEIRYWPDASDAYYGGLWSIVDLSDSGDINHVWLSGNKLRASRSLNKRPLTESVHVCYTIDDLTAMQEDVTEFEMSGINDGSVKVRFDCSQGDSFRISIVDGYGVSKAARVKFKDSILGLRQMQATLNRKKGSE